MNPIGPSVPVSPGSATRPSHSRILVAVVVSFVLLALTYSVVNPIFESNDETMHFYTALHLAEGRGFAKVDATEPWLQEAAQPPLYYLLTAALIAPVDTSDAEGLLWNNLFGGAGSPTAFGNKNRTIHTDREAWPYRQTVLAVHLARALSIVFGALTIALIFAVVRVLLPAAPGIALAAAALTAFTPQFVFLSASVSNDNVTHATVALAVWVLLRGLRGPRPKAWAALLGVTLGLAGLSKVTGLLLWLLAGLAILAVGWRQGRVRRALFDLIVVFGVAAAIAGWWYARNWLHYGDPTGVYAIVALVEQAPGGGGLAHSIAQLRDLHFSYWGMFGWFNILSPNWLYGAVLGWMVLAILGIPLALFPRLAGSRTVLVRRADLPWLLVPAGWLALVAIALLRYNRLLPALQGRLLMPAAWGLNLFLVLGWAGLVVASVRLLSPASALLRQSLPRLLAAAPLGLLAAWALIAPFAIIAPAYAWPARVAPGEVPDGVRRPAVDHGGYVRFLGGAPDRDTVRPGEKLTTTAYWQALAPMTEDYVAIVHALAPDGRAIGVSSTWPGRGGYPTRLWQPGEVVVDVQQVTIPEEAERAAPMLLRLDAGFSRYPSGVALPGYTADGTPARSLIGQVRLLPAKPPAVQPSTPLTAQFGDSIRLVGYTLAPGSEIKPGQPLTLTLYWDSTARLSEDWTVLVHLRPKGGGAQIGADGPPRAGAWPTSAWEPGYPVEDAHVLDLPADAPNGPAELWIGLYRADGARLPISGTTGRTQDQALYLQDLTMERSP